MFFKKKNKHEEKCSNCKSGVSKDFDYCPYCGLYLLDKNQEMKEFGMLGKKDFTDRNSKETLMSAPGLGITDKIIGAMVNSLMKNLDKQFRDMNSAEVKPIPNGFSIKIGPANQKQEPEKQKKEASPKKNPTAEQMKRFSSMPKTSAKSNVKRLGNKIVYELGMEGIRSPEDIFVSKLENGYEIKAIGQDNVYVNTIPLDLPVKSFKIDKDKITIEFKTEF